MVVIGGPKSFENVNRSKFGAVWGSWLADGRAGAGESGAQATAACGGGRLGGDPQPWRQCYLACAVFHVFPLVDLGIIKSTDSFHLLRVESR